MAKLKELSLTIGLSFLLFQFTNVAEGATMCYSCNHIAHPRDCDRVVQCNQGEKCHVITYAQADGNYYYNVGCMKEQSCPSTSSVLGKRDLAICNRCCDGNYCNKELCDGKPQTQHGPRCLKCATVDHPNQCGAVTECAIGQVCFTREKYVFGERRYQLGCANEGCSPLSRFRSLINRQAGQCEQCCHTENCNRELCTNTGSPLTVAPATDPAVIPTAGTQQPGHSHVHSFNGCYYKGKVYQEGQTWDEACDFRCTCVNATSGKYVCQDICPTYIHVPDFCHMEKPPGECCAVPVCKGNNHTTVTNFTSSTLINDCFYQGKTYKQNETWHDGCTWECNCMDASKGYYRCHSMCYEWNLPPKCHLDDPAPGKCCKTPSCPAGYTIQYPPGYVVN